MSLPSYPKYITVNNPWVEKIPVGWSSVALSRVLAQAVTDGPHSTPVFVDSGVPFLSVDAIQDGQLSFENCRFISKVDHIEFSRKAAPRSNDILMGKAASVGKIARVQGHAEFSIWSPLALIRVDPSLCLPAFAEYTLKSPSLQAQIETKANSNTQLNIGMKDIPKLRICLPPLVEQAEITEFIDHETAKIDVLIAEQEKLLVLLAEKRQATISHAVTRGLDPNAPMKDSGIAWLGTVPTHWEVRRVKDVARLESGHTPSKQVPEYWIDCDVPWVSLNDSKQLATTDYISDTAVKISAAGLANSSARLLPAGVVVFTRDATIGLAAITTTEMAVSQHLIAWCPSGSLNALYLLRVFNSMKAHLESLTAGATIKTIGMDDIKALAMPFPPFEEQKKVVDWIEVEIRKVDAAAKEVALSIGLLKERRTALIAAAVTGQIDVRGLVTKREAA